jgi:LacI family gluconate utilization system Gnt-I transcriptional repressor
MTVSRVLRNKGYVSDAVAKKVLEAAQEIGYVRNHLAGSLSEQSTNLIGVIIPSLSNSVFTEVLSGFEDAIHDSSFQMAIGVSNYDHNREFKLVSDMLAWRPAGIVLTGLQHDARTRKLLIQNKVRTVEMIDVDGKPVAHCVGLSHRAAAEATANHLIARGYTRFGYVGSALAADDRAQKRKDAFENTLAERGFKIEREAISPNPTSMPLGKHLTSELLQDNSDQIAVYYSNDDMASGGLLHCLAKGLSVPKDVAIASFNGLEFLEALPMRITTFKSPRYKIGQMAGRYVLGEITDTITELPGELIVGDTT